MKNEEKTLKFPVGAIFMLLFVLLDIIQLIQTFSIPSLVVDFGLISRIIRTIALCAIAVLVIMKNRGVGMLVSAGLIALLTIIYFSVSSLFYLISIACIILFSLDDMKIGSFAKYRKIIKNALVISVLADAVLNIVFYVIITVSGKYTFDWLNIPKLILLPLSLLLVGLWIYDPTKKITENGNSDINNNYYVSLGKHICLLIFTFGIWQMIWIYKQTKFTNIASGEEERNPATKLLLYLFIPFYSIYWTYKTAQRIDSIGRERGVHSDLGTVCLILAIFVPIVPPILMQDKVNQIITGQVTAPKQKENDTIESIEKYKDLLDAGIITQEEFDAKKKQLLGL